MLTTNTVRSFFKRISSLIIWLKSDSLSQLTHRNRKVGHLCIGSVSWLGFGPNSTCKLRDSSWQDEHTVSEWKRWRENAGKQTPTVAVRMCIGASDTNVLKLATKMMKIAWNVIFFFLDAWKSVGYTRCDTGVLTEQAERFRASFFAMSFILLNEYSEQTCVCVPVRLALMNRNKVTGFTQTKHNASYKSQTSRETLLYSYTHENRSNVT